MSFLGDFESKVDGVNDTVEFVIRVAVVTLSAVILVVVVALVVGLFVPNDVVDSAAIIDTINPAFQTIIGAFVGLLGGLSLNANARDKEEPVVDDPLTPSPVAVSETPNTDSNDDDDDMEPWEKYRNDLRYDRNHDGIVDENDFPDWRNAGQ
jgi:hypothetical protein